MRDAVVTTGRTPLERLKAAPEEINPALLMAWELKLREARGELDIEFLLPMAGEIDDAYHAGAQQARLTELAMRQLMTAAPARSADVPHGF
jgi:hypothetical protein